MPAVKKSKKKMRVATAFTDAAAATAVGVFVPMPAHAAVETQKIWVWTGQSVSYIQLCGYREPAGTWQCTVKHQVSDGIPLCELSGQRLALRKV
jgi:hypothetical protein